MTGQTKWMLISRKSFPYKCPNKCPNKCPRAMQQLHLRRIINLIEKKLMGNKPAVEEQSLSTVEAVNRVEIVSRMKMEGAHHPD